MAVQTIQFGEYLINKLEQDLTEDPGYWQEVLTSDVEEDDYQLVSRAFAAMRGMRFGYTHCSEGELSKPNDCCWIVLPTSSVACDIGASPRFIVNPYGPPQGSELLLVHCRIDPNFDFDVTIALGESGSGPWGNIELSPLGSLPAALRAYSHGEEVFHLWHSLFGLALANALLTLGFRAMIADGENWISTLQRTWDLVAERGSQLLDP